MKLAVVGLGLALVLVAAGTASAGGKAVQSTLSGNCNETDKLDHNGALLSATIVCDATGSCKCADATKLDYSNRIVEPGTGADGRESGTFIATGPQGTVTLEFKGIHQALGGGKGTWTLGKVTGYTGVHLTRRGTYSTLTKTLSSVTGTFKTVVRINATLGCWACSST